MVLRVQRCLTAAKKEPIPSAAAAADTASFVTAHRVGWKMRSRWSSTQQCDHSPTERFEPFVVAGAPANFPRPNPLSSESPMMSVDAEFHCSRHLKVFFVALLAVACLVTCSFGKGFSAGHGGCVLLLVPRIRCGFQSRLHFFCHLSRLDENQLISIEVRIPKKEPAGRRGGGTPCCSCFEPKKCLAFNFI